MIRIEGLCKRFGATTAVADLNLEISEREFFTFLGPSGCGKTTTLRCIGGLERPDAGEIFLGDRCLVAVSRRIFVPPERRQMGMVFQSYALWPHMSVFENVAYPLRLRRIPKDEIRKMVLGALQLVGLDGFQDRQAPQLSGGQQQRVALARALVFSPQVLLLDEPLSNLDALLRDEMRRELKELQSRVNVTMVFVTHDQTEALSLSDRIAIMNEGVLQQVGTPKEVYTTPLTAFAQGFLGRTFSLDGTIVALKGDDAEVVVEGAEQHQLVAPRMLQNLQPVGQETAGAQITLSIRPEQMKVWAEHPEARPNVLPSQVQRALFIGDRYEYLLQMGSAQRVLPLPSSQTFDPGDTIYLEFPKAALTIWPR